MAPLVKHSSGVKFLRSHSSLKMPEKLLRLTSTEILDVLAQSFDFVVVDTGERVRRNAGTGFRQKGLVLFVTEMDVPSLKSAHRERSELFERMGIYHKKIRLVLNRYVKSKLMSLESVEKALGVKVFWTLPNNYPTAIAAVNQGLSIEGV